MVTKPKKAPAPPAPPASRSPGGAPASPQATIPSVVGLDLTRGVTSGSDRIVIYGTGGIGKSTLAAQLPGPLFLDLEGGTRRMDVLRDTAKTWADLRGKLAAIAATTPDGVQSLIIDSASVAEELAKEHVVQTRTTEKGQRVDSIERFGWGKGWQFVYDEFNGLLADLDRIADSGLNVCMIAHDTASPVPNPAGEDYIRWEPHLYAGDKKGRGSVRDRVKQWADHMLFIGYDIFSSDGKAQGSGTRTIYSHELPTHVALSRSAQVSIPFDLNDPGAIWRELDIE